ncbi:hypothetical protein GYB59_24260 [bacterium]|nr:hypothetical protein [bacterium]
MEILGLTLAEWATLIGGLVTFAGFVWWCAGMYSQLKRGVDQATEVKTELTNMKVEFKQDREKLFSLFGDHDEQLKHHAINLARLNDRVGIPVDNGTGTSSSVRG